MFIFINQSGRCSILLNLNIFLLGYTTLWNQYILRSQAIGIGFTYSILFSNRKIIYNIFPFTIKVSICDIKGITRFSHRRILINSRACYRYD